MVETLSKLLYVGVAGLTVASALPVASQHNGIIPDTPSCRSCRIVLGISRIPVGDDEHPTFGPSRFMGPASRQRYLVGAGNGGPPEAFDAQGRYLATLGRKGSGPGEYRSASAFAVGPADSIAVFDPMNGRVQIVSGDLSFVRSFGLPYPVINGGMIWLPGQAGFVISGPRSTPSEVGYAIHFYGPDGRHLRSIDESREPVVPRSSGLESFRLLCPLLGSQLVSVSAAGGYRVDVWDVTTGQLRARWVRQATWFEAKAGPFQPRIVAAQVDSAGLLWTLIAVPSEDWEKGVRPIVIGGTERTFEIVDRELIMDSVIEVIDIRTGKLVAQRRTGASYFGLLPNGLLVSESADSGRLTLVPVTLGRD